MLKNTSTTYGSVTKFFHWLMVILLISMFIFGYTMTSMNTDTKYSLYDIHKATGLLLFALVTLRLSWRWINPQPPLPNTVARWQKVIAKLTIGLLYLCMFFMPITGYLTSTLGNHDISFYGLFVLSPLANNHQASEFFAGAHEWVSYLLIFAFSMHILGTLYHHFMLKDAVAERMAI
jgi:cytochrome b561